MRSCMVKKSEHLWSAKLSLPSPSRGCEVLELPVDLVQIKGLRIKLAPDPVQHLLMLGVLRIVDRVQKARVPPDTTAILGRTGAFACEAYRVALPCFVGEHLFNEQLVVPAIAKVILIEELILFALHQGLQSYPASVFALHLLQHARVAILHTTDFKAVQMVAFPPHDALQNMVELR